MTTVYITGASAGLGRAIAEACAAVGHSVGLIARDATALETTARSLTSTTAWAAADVACREELEVAVQSLEAEIGPPDIWINNAMATIFSRFADITPEEFARSSAVTFLGSVHGLQLALRVMQRRGWGQIIQIGSALAYRPVPLQAPYCASKFAIRAVIDSLRSELAHDRIPVFLTTVQMPAMNTPQFDWARRHIAQHQQPVPPIYAPEACAKAVLWAVKHPEMREVWVGKTTLQAIIGNKFLPGFMDRYMARNAYEAQFEKPADNSELEGNLFHSVPGCHHTEGRFTHRQRTDVVWVGTSERREIAFYSALLLVIVLLVIALIAL